MAQRVEDADCAEYDVVVVGSGFGGSVAALRLTEKGYRVAVLEAGRRFAPEDLPKTNWDLRNFLWMPRLGMTGIQRISLLRDVMVVSGAGVGGGSLVYANVLYEPLEPFYTDQQWAHITDWRAELAPFYDQAKRMLGVTTNTGLDSVDEVMRQVAEDMGVGDTFRPTDIGVYLGEPGVIVDDPYFGGVGPKRTGCLRCGQCMTGCRHGAKNTLGANYLYLAERAGATVYPLTTATEVRPDGDGRYTVETVGSGGPARRERRTFAAEHVVFAAGALGTQRLLHKLRDGGALPRISARLGELSRTNSEAVLRVMARGKRRQDEAAGPVDYSEGPAIGSSFFPEPHTHVEPARYGRGSSSMAPLATMLVDGGGRLPRWLRFCGGVVRHPLIFLRSFSLRRWAERTVILLVMQARDNSITVYGKRGPFGHRLASRQGRGEPNPAWIPVAHEVARRAADKMDGDAGGTWGQLANIPLTAHFVGGCTIGDSPETGVVDPYHRLYGHPGLHVVDGSAVTANLGVNPSLTIAAQAERAMAFWPNNGEPDPRPELGSAYRRIDAVTPHHPVVPSHAPAALRLSTARR
ncbi:MAG: FAD-dependent oxidoreductase [Streptosporangiales bacterium]|nr:FAD-dependent oxidoreductase [Streptosporangiales bacterium]